MILLIFWLLIGGYGLVENSDIIATIDDKKMRVLGMAVIAFSTPLYILTGIFDFILGQIFGEGWDNNDGTGCC